MDNRNKYSSLYKVSFTLIIEDKETINIPTSDIVSVSIINNYDTMTYPIIRVRLYSDISLIQKISEHVDKLHLRGNLDGGIYQMNSNDKSPTLVSPIKSIPLHMKIFIESKNIPTSYMDQYENGKKKNDDLNTDIKVPIEFYCYDEKLIHLMKQKVQSIYKNMSIISILNDILVRGGIVDYTIDPLQNNNKYEQVLIPNLNISQSLAFFDNKYGLYNKGAQLYGDIDKLYLCNTDINNGTVPLPIYVDSYKSNDDMVGMKKINNKYFMSTLAQNVSVMSETDVERVLNSENITSINVKELKINTNKMKKLYLKKSKQLNEKIVTPDILHKTRNPFISETYISRVNERMTCIDLSCSGIDISKLKINTRYNLIFESPLRGTNMNEYYRTAYICNVLTCIGGNLFTAQTTMKLCSN